VEVKVDKSLLRKSEVELVVSNEVYLAKKGRCILEFMRLGTKRFEVYENASKVATIRCVGDHTSVINEKGVNIITINDDILSKMEEEEFCEVIAGILFQWLEK